MILTPLEAGDRAEGFGSVVRLVDGFGLKYDDGDPGSTPEPEIYEPRWSVVRIQPPDGGAALLGRHFAVAGRWTGSTLVIDRMDVRPPPTPPAQSPGSPPSVPGRPRDPAALQRAELQLLEDGVLLSRMFDHLGVAHVVAHDVARTEEALRPFYGDALLVTRSPWSRDDFRHIEALIHTADREGVLFESGTSGTDDLTLSHWIGITYCTATMSDIAKDIPDGALRVEILLQPVPTTAT